MTDWDSRLLHYIQSAVEEHPFWEKYIDKVLSNNSISLHLAIFVEPYLKFILEGKKTVESRFSMRLCPPYKCAQKGDIIILKKSGGPVIGLCRISQVWFYELDPNSWKDVKKRFSKAICANDVAFWNERENALFATLMKITDVYKVAPYSCRKRDRRGWVILNDTCRKSCLFKE